MSSPPSSPAYKQTPTNGSSYLSSWPNGQTQSTAADSNHPFNPFQIFNNPFNIEDLAIFDDSTLHRLLHDESPQLSIEDLASSLCNSSAALREHIEHVLSPQEHSQFHMHLRRHLTGEELQTIRQQVLDKLLGVDLLETSRSLR